ncbi:hypothetical protein B0H13DRAFT_2290272 [Mycena leptocephala]|nr:hypothetical protein B0H13DRAFT_2290272 [Mycena leptocephala]
MSTENEQLSRPLEDVSRQKLPASALRSRLSQIERQIAALAAQMAPLRAEREMVSVDLATIVYPVLTLPNEIFAEIFIQYVDEHPNRSQMRLASVCRLWRAVAVYMPPWFRLRYSSHLADLLLCWLPRAGRLPLDICLKLPTSPSPESDQILRILGQYSSQWKRLDLASNGPFSFPADVRGPFPHLTTVALWAHPSLGATTIPALVNAPHLREVQLDAAELVYWRTSFPWTQLTNLDLLFHDVLECLEILTSLLSGRIMLHRLHTLKLGPDGGNELLPYLNLPALDDLRLSSVTWESVEAVAALITPSPTALLLSFYDPEEVECMHDFLSRVPSVRSFHMLCPGITNAHFRIIFDFLSEDPILPALTSFIIDEYVTDIPLRPLIRMLAVRRAPIAGDNYAEVNMKEQDKDMELALAGLGDLRSQGLQMDVQSTIKWLSGNITSQILLSVGIPLVLSIFGVISRNEIYPPTFKVARVLDPAPRKGNDPDPELGASLIIGMHGKYVNPTLDQSRTVRGRIEIRLDSTPINQIKTGGNEEVKVQLITWVELEKGPGILGKSSSTLQSVGTAIEKASGLTLYEKSGRRGPLATESIL